ncbi:MAG: carboxynorspermidine decarboxylase [Lentisphaerae bacterium]|nr:carboxynorspermidine decarboxylase [Lentisphaerota bacterium]
MSSNCLPDLSGVSTPCYLVDEKLLKRNLQKLAFVREQSQCKMLLALKAFAMYDVADLVGKYLDGVAASSIDEARLGKEKFRGEVHMCAPAYREKDLPELLTYIDHIVFNSSKQWRRLHDYVVDQAKDVSFGIRVNHCHSEVATEAYDPCRRYSRLGVVREEFDTELLEGITGLHFHSLCELGTDALERTLAAFETQFGQVLYDMEWVNFGGGHHITRDDYNVDRLCELVSAFRDKYGVAVYLEPGEAIALNAGYLIASVIDITKNENDIAILDTSASAHMPDVLEMPYRPKIIGADDSGKYKYNYTLGGMTCLAGDVIGDYSFPKRLEIGDKLVFCDMAHYTMVKNTTFNGIRLPSIALIDAETRDIRVVKEFSYEDFVTRLGSVKR